MTEIIMCDFIMNLYAKKIKENSKKKMRLGSLPGRMLSFSNTTVL